MSPNFALFKLKFRQVLDKIGEKKCENGVDLYLERLVEVLVKQEKRGLCYISKKFVFF